MGFFHGDITSKNRYWRSGQNPSFSLGRSWHGALQGIGSSEHPWDLMFSGGMDAVGELAEDIFISHGS